MFLINNFIAKNHKKQEIGRVSLFHIILIVLSFRLSMLKYALLHHAVHP